VPANPYAKQNFLRDCTNPIEKIKAGKKIKNLGGFGSSLESNPIPINTVRNAPTKATN
jgi:hypothetical protein